MARADGEDQEQVEVTFTSRDHDERAVAPPRALDAWETAIVSRFAELAEKDIPASLTVIRECTHCPSIWFSPEVESIGSGYFLRALPVELVGVDCDGMEMRVMLRLAEAGSPAWLEAYRLDGQAFACRPEVTSLTPASL